MKRLFFAALLAIAYGSTWADNRMSVGNVVIKAGEQANLVISLENDGNVAGYNFTLILPEGITFVYDVDEEDYLYGFSDRTPTTNNGKPLFYANIQESSNYPNAFLVGVDNKGKASNLLDGNSGPIITLTLQADPSFEGTANVRLVDVAISDENGVAPTLDDVAFIIIEQDTAMGIKDMLLQRSEALAPTYDLRGLRIASPMKKGIYIRQSRKVVK